MAKKKKQQSDPKTQTLARIKRTEAYAERVRALFAATVNEILALNKTLPALNEGEMFSFDNESLKKQHEVERLLRQLHSVATMAIEKGIRLEWATANAECDKLVQSCFGKKALETPEFTAWTQRNEAAQAAFISRSERGLNLSQRVWKTCRQLRDEMEVAITVAVGDGTSAASMSRSVRKYLNDPDLMFRRFRYKAGEESEYDEDGNEIGKKIIWGKKWKKKIRKSDGTVGWIDYDKDSYRDEWTGSGYYKSSAQNAMRVARTETNIAYRRADNERWRQMDFVLGQRVQLSRNHPKKDVCDKLAGDYPPEFVFDGWHPQCFCFVTPILMDENEIQKMNEAMLRGETYKPRGKRITQYPENFKQWVRDNEERIVAAHDIGTDPYFVRNNFGAVQDILNPKKQLTPQEIAAERHAARKPAEIADIQKRWEQRLIRNLSNDAIEIDVYDEFYSQHISQMRNAMHNNDTDGFKTQYENAVRSMKNLRNKIVGAVTPYTPHAAMKTEYKTLDDVRDSLKTIGDEQSWFPTGRMKTLESASMHANGSSSRPRGRIRLTPERSKLVQSAMQKIGNGESWKMTKAEADAMSTLWHEMNHQMHIGDESAGDKFSKSRSYMELANEFVSRRTLPDLYKSMGCKTTPYPGFIEKRASTGYDDMVRRYQYVIDVGKLKPDDVLSSVRNGLFNSPYDKQKTVLVDGLIAGGIKGKRTDIAKLVEMCESEQTEETILKFMKDKGLI